MPSSSGTGTPEGRQCFHLQGQELQKKGSAFIFRDRNSRSKYIKRAGLFKPPRTVSLKTQH
jgi:hypothetical protein